MFYATNTMYRVVVSHNKQRPNNYLIDICRDGFCSHDMLFRMQKKYYEDEKLERVFNDSRGIMLVASQDGSVHLRYTKHHDKMAQHYQAKLRQEIDPLIITAFQKMKESGKIQTISVPLAEINPDLQRACKHKGCAENIREEEALKAAEQAERLARLKEIRHKFYLNQKHASAPHLRLMLKQAERSGD